MDPRRPSAHASAQPPTLELRPPVIDPMEAVPAHIVERFREEYRESKRKQAARSDRLLAHMAAHLDDALPPLVPPRAARAAAADARAHGPEVTFELSECGPRTPPAPADLRTRRHGADRHRVFSQFVGAQSLSQEGGSPKGRRRIVPPEPPN